MKIQGAFLNSRLGRKIFSLFVFCALLPVVLLSLVAFMQVKHQLRVQGQRELQQSTKAIGMSLYERMVLLESEIERISSLLPRKSPGEIDIGGGVAERFDQLLYVREGKIDYLLTANSAQTEPLPSLAKLAPEGEKPRIYTLNNPKGNSRVFFSRDVRDANGHLGFLTGEINTNYLWKIGSSNILPPNTELCVFSGKEDIIISSLQSPQNAIGHVPADYAGDVDRQFEWTGKAGKYFGTYWSVFMESRFDSRNWTVVLSKKQSDVYAPIQGFRYTFFLVLLLAVMSVGLFSMINIRFTLVPLEKIRAGIKKISRQDFSARVEVAGKDEFGEVANIFNAMSYQLDEQFRTIRTMSEIDNAILSSLEPTVIMDTMLKGLEELVSCAVISVSVVDKDAPEKAVVYYNARNRLQSREKVSIDFPWQQLREEFAGSQSPVPCSCSRVIPQLHGDSRQKSLAFCYAIPVYARGALMGVVSLGYVQDSSRLDKDLNRAQQLADQMGVALANSSLVHELDRLHWASIRALAKTVDAKSSWTAGHSERVCELAVDTALMLNMDQRAIEVLRQAALLHDIGKVGIPNTILDKPGKLTDAEYAVIKEHPGIGAKILEPIEEYSEVLPIVLQHHERFDGLGYPGGLKGSEIVYEARIMAVADVFEALSSDRPYRSGWSYEKAAGFVSENAGTHFDPEVAEAFLRMLQDREKIRA